MNYVKKYRLLANLTQDELAIKSFVSQATIYTLETEPGRRISLDIARAVVDALNKNGLKTLTLESVFPKRKPVPPVIGRKATGPRKTAKGK